MNRMNRIPKEQNDSSLVRALSCKSCSSCPKHLFLVAAGRAGPFVPFGGYPLLPVCMAEVNVYYDPAGRTLTVWFGRRQAEYVCEETGEEVVLMKDRKGHVLGFERLNY